MDLMELAVQAVDGTKVRANASKDRTYDGCAVCWAGWKVRRRVGGGAGDPTSATEQVHSSLLTKAHQPLCHSERKAAGMLITANLT